jgi:hypothetical protein
MLEETCKGVEKMKLIKSDIKNKDLKRRFIYYDVETVEYSKINYRMIPVSVSICVFDEGDVMLHKKSE